MADILPFRKWPNGYDTVPELDNEPAVFIDYLTIRQVHPAGDLERVTGGFITHENHLGVVEWAAVKRAEHEGSFDDKMHIRCDGSLVEFHGNISRWNRPDNLFGYSWDETIKRVNRLLNLYSLPPFTKGELTRYSDAGWQWSGARVSRIDITQNHAFFSSENAQTILQFLGSQHVGRQKGTVTPDGATVLYGYDGGKYVSGKVYNKAAELLKHRKKKSGSHVSDEVIELCQNMGVLREEFTLKSRFLTQNELCFLGAITQDALASIYRERSQMRALSRFETTDTNHLTAAQRGTLARWENGEPIDLKKSQFYAHRRALLSVGVDISTPKNNVQKLVQPIKVIERAVLVAPEWYRRKHG